MENHSSLEERVCLYELLAICFIKYNYILNLNTNRKMFCLFVENMKHIWRYNKTREFIYCMQEASWQVYFIRIKHW